MATSTVIIDSNDGVTSETPANPGTAKIRVVGSTAELSVNAGAYSPLVTDATAALVTGTAEALAPSITFTTTPTSLLAYAPVLTAAKTVLLTVQGTAYSTGATTEFHFYVKVGATETAVRRFFFNNANEHATFAGSWIVALPAGTLAIDVMAVRVEGSGTITLTADDFVCLTYIG